MKEFQLQDNHRIRIFVGHYGSGKSEIALNCAIAERRRSDNVAICDLDIVNPYFRTNDAHAYLEEAGIAVIASPYANTNLDMPVLPGEVMRVFSDKTCRAVLDVGGDDDGAVALGQYYPYLKDADYSMYLVVNLLRPSTADVEDIVQMARNIEAASRLKITGLVNNTNLSYESTARQLSDSMGPVQRAADALGVPLSFATARRDIAEQLGEDVLPLDLQLSLPFKPEL